MITGHKCRGSGYFEILLEAQLVTSGCLKSVLSGKAYAKALFCLKTVCEAMEQLIMEQFLVEESIQIDDPVAILQLVKYCNRDELMCYPLTPVLHSLGTSWLLFKDKQSCHAPFSVRGMPT